MEEPSNKMLTVCSSVPTNRKETVPKKTNRRKWKKPKDKPKRPLSAYNLFFAHERNRLIEQGNTKMGFGGLAKSISGKWKTLTTEQKQAFNKQATAEKQRYKKDLEQWKATKQPQQIKRNNTTKHNVLTSSYVKQKQFMQMNVPKSIKSFDKNMHEEHNSEGRCMSNVSLQTIVADSLHFDNLCQSVSGQDDYSIHDYGLTNKSMTPDLSIINHHNSCDLRQSKFDLIFDLQELIAELDDNEMKFISSLRSN